jgi:nucleotide-binding universal stress UspA family protein
MNRRAQWDHISAILVPVGGSTDTADALALAQEIARVTGATLRIVDETSEGRSPTSLLGEEAKKWGSSLIVMSSPVLGPTGDENELEKLCRDVLLQAQCPVLLVPKGRERRPWALRRMLFPHDGTPVTSTSLASAGHLCRFAKAEMTMLHVATTAAASSKESGALRAPYYMDQPQHEWPAWEQEFLDRARAIGKPPCDVKLRTVLCTDDIAQVILEVASQDETDLIALAWRMSLEAGRMGIMRLVIQKAHCPILIIPVENNAMV